MRRTYLLPDHVGRDTAESPGQQANRDRDPNQSRDTAAGSAIQPLFRVRQVPMERGRGVPVRVVGGIREWRPG
jgi:hypothetical protein